MPGKYRISRRVSGGWHRRDLGMAKPLGSIETNIGDQHGRAAAGKFLA
jgi:hypothetical protein